MLEIKEIWKTFNAGTVNEKQALRGVSVAAPVHIGDVVCRNVADTGVDMVATKEIW